MPTQYRQGDVLIELINEFPIITKKHSNLLAEGESRDHGHFITGNTEVLDFNGALFLDVKSDSQLEHLLIDSKEWTKEHKAIKIPAGKYRVIHQREYDPYKAENIRIAD